MARISFASDLDFLKANAEVVELRRAPQAGVAVVSAYQGRVMTSTPDGPEGPSYGWLNRPFIARGTDDPFAGDRIRHVHRTCHFEGQFDAINDLSMKVLGMDLNKLL